MVDEIATSSFDGNAARDTLPPDPPESPPVPVASRPFATRAHIPSLSAVEDPPAIEELHKGFISDQRLADLLFQRRVMRVGRGLVEAEGRRYVLENAVRVVGRQDRQMSDPYGLAGTVEPFDELVRAGAQFTGRHMHLGSVVYRVERGVLALARDEQAVVDFVDD
jgi:hypothetical protein